MIFKLSSVVVCDGSCYCVVLNPNISVLMNINEPHLHDHGTALFANDVNLIFMFLFLKPSVLNICNFCQRLHAAQTNEIKAAIFC